MSKHKHTDPKEHRAAQLLLTNEHVVFFTREDDGHAVAELDDDLTARNNGGRWVEAPSLNLLQRGINLLSR